MKLQNEYFQLDIDDRDGSLTALVHPSDQTGMSWIRNTDNCSIHQAQKNWGKGWVQLTTGRRIPFGVRQTVTSLDANRVSSREETELFTIEVVRELRADILQERFIFTNNHKKPVELALWQIYTPFADEYLEAEQGLRTHCTANIWTGGSDSWVQCNRMSSETPHLGLVLTSGQIQGYAIEDRDYLLFRSSDSRGTIAMLPTGWGYDSHPDWPQEPVVFEPGAAVEIAWSLFWFNTQSEFTAGVEEYGQGVRLRGERLVSVGERPARIFSSIPGAEVDINGSTVRAGEDGEVHWTPDESGEYTFILRHEGRDARLVALHLEDPMERIKTRAEYIIRNQQVHDTADPLYGAYLVYDTEAHIRVRNNATADRRMGYQYDVNPCRERMGMGVLLSKLLSMKADIAGLQASVPAYDEFFHRSILNPDGSIQSDTGELKPLGLRLYDASMAQFYLYEIYNATGEVRYLREAFTVLKRYFDDGGSQFCGFILTLPQMLDALEKERMHEEHAVLAECYRRYADFLIAQGDSFRKAECAYESSIVAPAAAFLFQYYRYFGDEECLAQGKRYTDLLEMFQGYQPDYRLHGVSVRHWDGFWFGKHQMWGDIMPHHWSALSGIAYWERWLVENDAEYREKAYHQIMADFCNLLPDGRGSCAFVYPLAVDGEPAHMHDPYANDQDWAAYFFLCTFMPYLTFGENLQ